MTTAQPNPTPRGGLSGRVMLGASLFMGSKFIVRLLNLVAIAALGRLLQPADFGVVALAMVVIGLKDALINNQFSYALVRQPDLRGEHFDTAFALSASFGVIIGAAMFALADPVARALDSDVLADTLRVMAILPMVEGFKNPYMITYERDLKFKIPAIAAVVGRVALTVTSIAVAFALRNHWALVAGLFARVFAEVAFSYAAAPGRPGLSLKSARYFLDFGGWLSAAGVANFAEHKLPVAVIGDAFGATMTGFLHMGQEIATLLTTNMVQPFARALYPGLVAVADQKERLRRAYLKAQAMMVAAFLPIGVGLAAIAPEAITVALGEKWLPAAPVVQLLAIVSALNAVTAPVSAINMTTNQTRHQTVITTATLIVQIPLLFAGLFLFGFIGVVYGRCAALLFKAALAIHFGVRVVGGDHLDPLRASWRSFVSAAALAAATLGARAALGWPDAFIERAAVLTVMIAAGAIAYGVTHLLLWRLAGRPDGVERAALQATASALSRIRRRLGR